MDPYARGALVVLAVIAAIGMLNWGAPFFIPLFIGLLIAYALAPITDAITRLVKWRVLAASIVVFGLVGALGGAVWAWSEDIARLWQRVPVAARTIADSFKEAAKSQPTSPVAEVKKAAAEIEAIAQTGTPPARTAPAAPAPTSISFWQLIWEGGKGAAVVATQVMVVLFLVFFMLASGDMFKRKIVRLAGKTLSEKKITVQMIDEIDNQVRRYLLVLLVCNLLVGLGTWLSFRMLGVEYAELWGLTAGVMHTAPYFGPAIIALASLVAAFMQYHEWPRAFLVAGVSIGVTTLVGSVFATWLSARQTRMNTTATFVGLLFFGWIWGLWGVLLGIPLLAIVKTICERYEAWQPVAELLSREEQAPKRAPAAAETNPPNGLPNP